MLIFPIGSWSYLATAQVIVWDCLVCLELISWQAAGSGLASHAGAGPGSVVGWVWAVHHMALAEHHLAMPEDHIGRAAHHLIGAARRTTGAAHRMTGAAHHIAWVAYHMAGAAHILGLGLGQGWSHLVYCCLVYKF